VRGWQDEGRRGGSGYGQAVRPDGEHAKGDERESWAATAEVTWYDGVFEGARTSGVGRWYLGDPRGVGRRNGVWRCFLILPNPNTKPLRSQKSGANLIKHNQTSVQMGGSLARYRRYCADLPYFVFFLGTCLVM